MSEPMTCPKCGVSVRPWCDESEPTEDRLFWCGRLERVIKGRMWDVIESETCLRRQLAQRDERIKALEADRDSYRQRMELAEQYHDQAEADLVAVAQVVRAAMDQEDRHSDAARRYPHDPRDLCACEVCVKVRDLPADVRERLMALERMGVDRE